jgi:calcineurin-like phosphoesterase family protein
VIVAVLALTLALGAGGGAPIQTEPSAVVWAVGDGADGTAPARRLARRIERDDPDAVLYLGDVYPSGTAADYARNYEPIYGDLAAITWPTMGNHEWGNRATGYVPYWRRYGRARPWYRFQLAGWELVNLNSQEPHGPGSPQLRWLERVLGERNTTCRLAFWHRPRFSAGTVHGDAADIAPLWRALRGHARLVINGHEHALIRYRRRAGLTEYVSGAGGSVRYALRPDSRLAFGRSDRTGALRMVLTPGEARIEFRAASGAVLDRSRASCRPGATVAGRGR